MDVYGEFRQLERVQDPEEARAVLSRHLGPSFASGRFAITRVKIKRFYYVPGSECRLLLEMAIRDHAGGAAGSHILFGKAFVAKDAKAIAASETGRVLTTPRYGPPLFHVPEWDMVFWGYPNDPDLPGLSLMADPERILARARVLPADFGLERRPNRVSARMTKYVPGKRCGYVYRFGPGSARAVYGKAYCKADGEKAYRVAQAVWSSEARTRGAVILPQPYSYDPEHKTIWQEVVSGKSFAKLASTMANLPEVTAEIGARLAALHGSTLDLPRRITLDFQVRDLKAKLRAVSKAFPTHADRLGALGERLLRTAGRLDPELLTPIHASFKFSHIFRVARGTAFIDFDGACLGDPGYDVGRFNAHLYRMMAKKRIASEVGTEAARTFRDAYNRNARRPLSDEHIGWFTAGHLVTSELYKLVKRGGAGVVPRLVELAERHCPGETS
jgi:hypothetical protein